MTLILNDTPQGTVAVDFVKGERRFISIPGGGRMPGHSDPDTVGFRVTPEIFADIHAHPNAVYLREESVAMYHVTVVSPEVPLGDIVIHGIATRTDR
jgi:hypothetical protein